MRIPTKKSHAALWADMDFTYITAIELGSGCVFSRKFSPPVGLWSMTHDLKAACLKRWPDGDFTVGDIARQYLRMRAEHLEYIRDLPSAQERVDGTPTE